jgi:hypothetical protein
MKLSCTKIASNYSQQPYFDVFRAFCRESGPVCAQKNEIDCLTTETPPWWFWQLLLGLSRTQVMNENTLGTYSKHNKITDYMLFIIFYNLYKDATRNELENKRNASMCVMTILLFSRVVCWLCARPRWSENVLSYIVLTPHLTMECE